MVHEINQLLIAVSIAIPLCILIVLSVINSNFIQDYKETKRIFNDFNKGEYQYIEHVGNQYWFSRNDEVGQSYQFNQIIFFGVDGGIKLRENYYIHKGILTFTLVHRYYYKKFQRVREQYMNQHTFRQMIRANEINHYDRYMKKSLNEPFKFFRG